jgi:hypothetical protein
MGRYQDRSAWAWIGWAGYGGGKAWREIDASARPHGHDLRVHGAVMLPVPPAARGQTCILAAVNEGRQRSQPEEQDQEDGEAAPHLRFMLAQTEKSTECNQPPILLARTRSRFADP